MDRSGSASRPAYIPALVAAALLFISLAPALRGQSLVDLAKKEKARREALKGKQAVVITNRDLEVLKPKLSRLGYQAVPETVLSEEEGGAAPAGDGENTAEARPVSRRMVPKVAPSGREMQKAADNSSLPTVTENLARTREKIDLLETRLGGLRQGLQSMNPGDARDEVQRRIAETEKRLEEAKADEAGFKAALDKLEKKS